jgi:diguanylate cyclase (GGDEF)-like protein
MLLVDTTTWVAVGAAIGSTAIAFAFGVLVVVLLLRARERREPDPEVALMLRESDERFDRMLQDLSEELERTRDDLRRSETMVGLASTIDLDALAEQVVETAVGLPGVDGAALVVPRSDEDALLATAGISRAEAIRQALQPAFETGARAVTVTYAYSEASSDPDRIRGGLAVPLAGAEAPVGTLCVFWRGEASSRSEEELAAVEELASHAGPAVENALRYRDASRLADLDALTGLHNRRYFHDTLTREVARAARYDRALALLIVDVDDFKAINARIGHLAADGVLAQLAERVRAVVRRSDVACRVGGDELAVILPESSLADAEQLFRRLRFALGNVTAGPGARLEVSAGVAELDPGDDPVALFERADEALYRAKQLGKSQAAAAKDGA